MRRTVIDTRLLRLTVQVLALLCRFITVTLLPELTRRPRYFGDFSSVVVLEFTFVSLITFFISPVPARLVRWLYMFSSTR
jgi:antibiotic biosynthesis monooxygenase (ABM) superfamily enzyme